MTIDRRAAAGIVVAAIVAAAAGWWLRGREPSAPSAPATFTGSGACAGCHAEQYGGWQASQHSIAMQEATATTVLGNFDGATVTEGAVTSRFFRRDGRFYVNTDGPDGKLADFEVKYTFGVYPLQQYLAPLLGGRLQALGLAWDARPQATGGQRWFHLYPGQSLAAGNPLHWTGIDQNWNYQCADCHSTNLRKNLDGVADTYNTSWSEISVGCEACHGPASNHVAWAKKESGWRGLDATKGLVAALDERRGVIWAPQATGTSTRSAPRMSSREIDTCARCHARRGQFSDDVHAGDEWLDAFRPALLDTGLYYADGQQRDEVYTWGSFLQSRMHAAGVTCADCHEPHTEQLRSPGNGVCAQCHAPAVFDAATHHHHAAGSKGAECAACHMPVTAYMVVDPRHDHSLRIPRPDRSVTLGTPNACNACHDDRDTRWAADAAARWYPERKPGFQGFAEAFDAAERGEPAAADALLTLINNPAQPALVRASAIARTERYLSPEFAVALSPSLVDPDPLVRAVAVEAIAAADSAARAERLTPLLDDPVRLVRMTAARALAGEPERRLLGAERGRFTVALDEWVAAQEFNADRPEALTNLGTLQFERGSPDAAITTFGRALERDPAFMQAAVNLADVYRVLGDEESAEKALRDALARSPGEAVLHHALGLVFIRQGKRAEALAALGKAQELAPEEPRFAFVYAVALHDAGKGAAAIATLRNAIGRNPYDRNLVDTLAAYEAETP